MGFSEAINDILFTVLTAIVPVATACLVAFVRAKVKESGIMRDAIEDDEMRGIAEDAMDRVMDAVLYVNQVYTESLKASGKFDEAAQKEAFEKAYEAALEMITEDTKRVIERLYGSFDRWLRLKIESCVNEAKKQ